MKINKYLPGSEHSLFIMGNEDLSELADIIVGRIQSLIPKEPVTQDVERPICQKDAIKFLGKSRQTLNKWRKRGIIKSHILGGRVYYLKSELLATLNNKLT